MPEAADIDREDKLSRYSQFPQSGSHAPSRVFIELCELQFSFLRGNRRQIIFARGHEAVPSNECTEVHSAVPCGTQAKAAATKVATPLYGWGLPPPGRRILTPSKDRPSAESKSISPIARTGQNRAQPPCLPATS